MNQASFRAVASPSNNAPRLANPSGAPYKRPRTLFELFKSLFERFGHPIESSGTLFELFRALSQSFRGLFELSAYLFESFPHRFGRFMS
jgi:hypothetical protein